MNLLKDINQKNGTTVIVVTHDPTVSEFANRKIIISDGEIIMDEGI
ncbi:hypothetical protein LJB90_03255 [Eubacteriales bacterium OttesenSCG-928-G02]|nr:hypothetical protein [Eubacteriales bacterium OttesenSCG-928-G02]